MIKTKDLIYQLGSQFLFVLSFSALGMGMSIKFSPTRRINDRRLVVCCLNKSCNVILMSSQKCVLVSECATQVLLMTNHATWRGRLLFTNITYYNLVYRSQNSVL